MPGGIYKGWKKQVKVFLFCWKLLLLQIQNRNEINNENIIVA